MFRGELVPTEAELARREGREYEPAGVLLERIRAERASGGGGPERRAAGAEGSVSGARAFERLDRTREPLAAEAIGQRASGEWNQGMDG